MEAFQAFIDGIADHGPRERTREVLGWVRENYPGLQTRVAWNQPMFTDHGTFIVGFSTAKKHLAVAPEAKTIRHFEDELRRLGVDYTQMLLRFPWERPMDYALLGHLIDFNIQDKKEDHTFWRPKEDW